MEELKYDLDHSKDYKLYKEAWFNFVECKTIDDLTDDELKILYSYDFIPFKEFPKPKYPDGFLIHWIIDDMLGTNIFKNGRSKLTNLCIRNRHIIPGNIIIAIQSIMNVPKTIRLNANLLALFKFADSETVLEDVYPLFSAFVKEEQFKELYEYATKEPFNALVIDATRGKPIFKKNFDKFLNISYYSRGINALCHPAKLCFIRSSTALKCNRSVDDLYKVLSSDSCCLGLFFFI